MPETKRRLLAPYGGRATTLSTAYPLATVQSVGSTLVVENAIEPRAESVRTVPLRFLPFPPRPGGPEHTIVGMGASDYSWPLRVNVVSEWNVTTGDAVSLTVNAVPLVWSLSSTLQVAT